MSMRLAARVAKRLRPSRKRAAPAPRIELASAISGLEPPYRIHVGAGRIKLPGWIDTDITPTSVYLDATSPWPVPPGSVELVFSDNMIEHLSLDQARAFLRAAHAAMRPGGWLRIVTPDPEGVARAYLLDGPAGDRMIERHRRHGYRIEHRVDLLRSIYHENGHCDGYLFDEAALRSELEAAGFHDVRRSALGTSDEPALSGLDTRTEPGDELLLLAIEAQA